VSVVAEEIVTVLAYEADMKPVVAADKAVDALTTKEGGNIKSIGKGGQIIGRGADLVVVDDPYSGREEAFSPSERAKVRKWFTSDVVSRMMPGGRIVVIHQRWHEEVGA
jgi:hypothetical protein